MLANRLCRLVAATSILGCPLACKPVAGATTAAAIPASAAGVIVGDGEVVTVEHPAQMLPRDTLAVGWVAGVSRVAEVFERDRLAEKFPTIFQNARREAVREVGYDIWDPAAYVAAGIDPRAAIGAAVLNADDHAIAVFFGLADVGKFKETARNSAGRRQRQLSEVQVGPATLMSDPSGAWSGGIVIRDGFAVLVDQRARDEDEPGLNYADAIAKLDPRQSLAASVDYRKALGGLRDADAMGFVNVGLSLAQMLGARDRDAEAVWREVRATGRQLVETLFDGVEGMGLTVAIKRTGPVVDGQLVVRDGGFIRRMIRTTPGGFALPKALNGQPLAMWAGNVDVDTAMELVELMVQAEGQNVHDLSIRADKELLGFNPEAELKPLLTGEFSVAVALEAPVDFKHLEGLPKQIGFTVQAKVNDTGKAEALLAKMDKSTTVAGMKVSKSNGEYTFEVPQFRTMRIVVAGDSLLVTTDKGLAARLASRSEGSMKRDTHPAGPFHVATLPNVGGTWLTHIGLGATWLAGVTGAGFDRSVFSGEGGVAWSEVETAKMSRAAKKKKVELGAAQEALDQARAEVEGAEFRTMTDGLAGLGTTAFVVQPNARGFSIAGGQFIGAPTLGAVVEGLMALSLANGSGGDRTKVDAARAELLRIEGEYRALRLKDYKRSGKGNKPATTKPAG